MQFQFWKYHGLGNDFILVDASEAPILSTEAASDFAQKLCDRHRGIGADGVLVLTGSTAAPHRMIIYNADGSRPEMCGNGLRCFARFLVEQGYTQARRFPVETDRGVLECEVFGEKGQLGQVRIDMGAPILERSEIPMTGGPGRCIQEPLQCQGEEFEVCAVSMGNPHLILFDWTEDQRLRLAPALEAHERFPKRTNVEFVRIQSPTELDVIVYERGCGYTEACGTGACAVVVAAILAERIPGGQTVTVRLPGGPLEIDVEPGLEKVWMSGPATPVFHGTWVG